MKTKPCVTCGTLKRIDLMVKTMRRYSASHAIQAKLLTRKERKQ